VYTLLNKRQLHRSAIAAIIATAAVALCLTGVPAWAVDGRIVQIGYRMSGTQDDVLDENAGMQKYREGTWVPILVELFNDENAPLFEGRLRVMQRDRDGDLAMTEEPVAVRGLRRYWLYTVANPQRGDALFSVQLLNADGNVVRIRDSFSGKESERLVPSTLSPPIKLGTEDVAILDISNRQVSQLYRLTGKARTDAEGKELSLSRPVVIARGTAKDLPSHWCGLDMVNAIVWDAPDPAVLPDAVHQMRALTEWVYHGGILVLGVGRTWQTVQKSALGPMLPGPLSASQDAQTLPEMAKFLSKATDDETTATEGRLKSTITICPLERSALRADTRVLYPPDRSSDRILVCRRIIGRGQIVYVGAELRDLYAQGGNNDDLTVNLLSLRRQSPRDEQTHGGDKELFPSLSGFVSFAVKAGLFFLFAIIFVVTYILVTTLGAWQWLKTRGWSRHSWTLFAALAVAASLLSLAAVRVIRGIGYEAEELNIVDLHANEYQGQGKYEAQATCFYGLKTGSHERLDILLPPDWVNIDEAADTPCTLRVLPPEPGTSEDYYASSDSYQIVPTRGRLNGVPFRATLKQFEGSWRGEIGGRITASITCTKDTSNYYRIDGNSWIKNELGVDLQECYLFTAEADPSQWPPRRSAVQIRAVRIGSTEASVLRNQETAGALDVRAYGPDGKREFAPTLADVQRKWADKFGVRLQQSYGQEEKVVKVDAGVSEAALFLLTTFQEQEPEAANSPAFGARTLARTYLTRLDLSDLLTKETMLFVGFSDTPGPARLCYRPAGTRRQYRAVRPSSCLTMYRVLIPVKVR
jgi:hypothetical protein